MQIIMAHSSLKRRRSANNRHAKYAMTTPEPRSQLELSANDTVSIPYFEDKSMSARDNIKVKSFKSSPWNESLDLTSLLMTNRLMAYSNNNNNKSVSHREISLSSLSPSKPVIVQPQLISTSNDALASENINTSNTWMVANQINPYNQSSGSLIFDKPWGHQRGAVANRTTLERQNSSQYEFQNDVPLLIGACVGGVVLVIILVIALCFLCERDRLSAVDTYSISSRNDSQPSITSRRSNFLKRSSSNLYINNPNSDDSGSNEVHFYGENIQHYSLAMHNPDAKQHSKDNGQFFSSECSTQMFFHNPVNSSLYQLDKTDCETLETSKPSLDESSKSRALFNGMGDNLLENIQDEENNQFDDSSRLSCYRAQSLPWPNDRKHGKVDDLNRYFDNSKHVATLGRIPFVKKQRNRMRSEIAAAIALNRSGVKLTGAKGNKRKQHKQSLEKIVKASEPDTTDDAGHQQSEQLSHESNDMQKSRENNSSSDSIEYAQLDQVVVYNQRTVL